MSFWLKWRGGSIENLEISGLNLTIKTSFKYDLFDSTYIRLFFNYIAIGLCNFQKEKMKLEVVFQKN